MPLLVKIAPDLADEDVARGRRPRAWHRGSTGSSRPTPPSRAAGCRAGGAVEAAGPGPVRRPAACSAPPRSCVCCASGSARPDAHRRRRDQPRAADAHERLEAGADLLQAYTAFVYEGALWPRRVKQRALVRRDGDDDVRHAAERRDRDAGAALRRHRPAPLAARRLGADRQCLRAREVRDDGRRGVRRRRTGHQAAVGVLRAARLEGHRRARAGHRGCREQGALVVLDVKRGDIGSTVQAYADAYLDPVSPLAVDAVTASPFLGVGSLDPLIDTALANDAGVFVLALTSNPEGQQVQHAVTPDGRTVAAVVLDAVATRNADVEGARLDRRGGRRDRRRAHRHRPREPRRRRPAAGARHRRPGRHPRRRPPDLRPRRPPRAPQQLPRDPLRRPRPRRAPRRRQAPSRDLLRLG